MGTGLYRDGLDCECFSENYGSVEMTLLKCMFGGSLVQLVSLYCRPNEPFGNLDQAIRSIFSKLRRDVPTIIVVDFNINFSKTNRKQDQLTEIMQEYGCMQLVLDVTTDSRTMIDLIFSNIIVANGTLESCYSYHKPLWMCMDFIPMITEEF
jgi:hypothetical protein